MILQAVEGELCSSELSWWPHSRNERGSPGENTFGDHGNLFPPTTVPFVAASGVAGGSLYTHTGAATTLSV